MSLRSHLRAYLELVRIPAVFTAPGDVVLGAFLASMWTQVEGWHYPILILSSMGVYCAGMALNDVRDVEVDAVERPSRPIPSGRISLRAAWTAIIIMQGLALLLASIVSLFALCAVAITIGLTYLYNSSLKSTALGPFMMGSCRYANVMIGVSAGGVDVLSTSGATLILCIPLFNLVYVFGLTHLARHEVHGADPAAVMRWAVFILAVACVPLCIAPVLFSERPLWLLSVLGLIPLWLIPEFIRLRAESTPLRIRFAVLRCIMGITVITGCLTVYAGGYWEGILVLCLLYPGKWFGRWFYAT